jgi:type VI secretion system protein ImpF
MAELTAQERLQPSLIDRLTDNAPGELKEALTERVLNKNQLRAAVLRDLSSLFNTTRLEPYQSTADASILERWKSAPEVRNSVVNFGLPSFSGEVLSSMDFFKIEECIKDAITKFEPRIDSKTLTVKVNVEGYVLDLHNMLRIQIHGFLWNQPVPLELMLSADIDVETGMARVFEAKRGR